MLSAPTVVEAARLAGIGERTARRWLTIPEFTEALAVARSQAFAQAVGILANRAAEAVGVLADVMKDSEATPGVRANAAARLIELSIRAREVLDLSERVAALESALEAQKEIASNEPT